MYKYFNERLPESFNNMFCALSHQNRTKCLRLERPIGKVLEQFPKVFLPQIWNSLSLEIKNSCSLNSCNLNVQNQTVIRVFLNK